MKQLTLRELINYIPERRTMNYEELIEAQIIACHERMSQYEPDSEIYKQALASLDKLMSIRQNTGKKDRWWIPLAASGVQAVGYVAGILILTQFNLEHVIPRDILKQVDNFTRIKV